MDLNDLNLYSNLWSQILSYLVSLILTQAISQKPMEGEWLAQGQAKLINNKARIKDNMLFLSLGPINHQVKREEKNLN